MSRYVDKKHGLTIGSGNYFFVSDYPLGTDEGEVRDGYNALVSFRGYRFDQPSTANVFIETPAEQLIWQRREHEEMRTYKDATYLHIETYYELTEEAIRWLDKHVGPARDEWDTYTHAEMGDRNVFFKRRKDALAFVSMIEAVLAGIKIGDW